MPLFFIPPPLPQGEGDKGGKGNKNLHPLLTSKTKGGKLKIISSLKVRLLIMGGKGAIPEKCDNTEVHSGTIYCPGSASAIAEPD